MAHRKGKRLSEEEQTEAIQFMEKDRSVDVVKKYKVEIKCKTPNQKKFVNLIKDKEIVICGGQAGTGKTFLSCAEALKLLQSEDRFRKIVIVKSVTVLEGEEVGYLKGGVKEKMEPFVYSFMSNFVKIIGKPNTEALVGAGLIETLPLAYLRGMSIDNSIIIIDECQNITKKNMRTIMTRLGENSKMIFIGDEKQIDLQKKSESSLAIIMKKFANQDGFGIMHFSKEDIVRNPLIKIIEDVFDEIDSEK